MQPLSIHYRRTFCLKNQLIRLRNLGEEAFGVALTQVKIANNRYYRTVAVRCGLLGRSKFAARELSVVDMQ